MKKKQIAGALLGLAIMGTTLPTDNVEAAGGSHKLTATEQKALFFSDLVYEVPKEESKDLNALNIKTSSKYKKFRSSISAHLPKGVSFNEFYDKAGLKNYRMYDMVRQTSKYPKLDDKIKATGMVVRAFYDKTGKGPSYMAIRGTDTGVKANIQEDANILYNSQIKDFYSDAYFTPSKAVAALYALNYDGLKKVGKQPTILTGHSLGGRIANFLGTIGKVKAITFAAPPYTNNEKDAMKKLVDKNKKYPYSKNITNFQNNRDQVTWGQWSFLGGGYLPGKTYMYEESFLTRVSLKYHNLSNYYEEIAK